MRINPKNCMLLVVCIVIAVFLISIVVYTGTTNHNDKLPDSHQSLLLNYVTAVNMKDLFTQSNEVVQVATPFSVSYKNNNKRTMFVCSTPIRYMQNEEYIYAEPSLIETDTGSYVTRISDQSVFFNNNCIRIEKGSDWLQINFPAISELRYTEHTTTLYGDRSVIQYYLDDNTIVSCFPSYTGVTVQYQIQEYVETVSIPVEFASYRINTIDFGCILLSDLESSSKEIMSNHVFALSHPLFCGSNNDVYVQKKGQIKKGRSGCVLNFSLPEDLTYPLTMTFQVNCYSDNMFFDCAAYEKNPSANHIFDNYVFFSSDKVSQTYNYMKFNIRSFTPKNSSLLDDLILNLNVLACTEDAVIEIYSVRNDWCSWELTWKNRPAHNEKIGEFTIKSPGWYSLDLTDYARQLIDNEYYYLNDNSILLKLKDDSEGMVVFASTDNGIYPPFFEINYRVSN